MRRRVPASRACPGDPGNCDPSRSGRPHSAEGYRIYRPGTTWLPGEMRYHSIAQVNYVEITWHVTQLDLPGSGLPGIYF